MIEIHCPWCGARAVTEFRYGGESDRPYPEETASLSDEQWSAYLFLRKNDKGPHSELWQHVYGCRRWFKALRDTATHEIQATVATTASFSGDPT